VRSGRRITILAALFLSIVSASQLLFSVSQEFTPHLPPGGRWLATDPSPDDYYDFWL